MHKHKVSPNVLPELERILSRKGDSYIIRGDDTILTSLSGHQFRKAVIRAKCETKNKEDKLPKDTTYYVSKIERINHIRAMKPGYENFIEYPQ